MVAPPGPQLIQPIPASPRPRSRIPHRDRTASTLAAVLPLALFLIAAATLAACDGDSGAVEPTSTAAATIAAAPTPSATAEGAGPPDVDGARIFEHVRQLAHVIGPRVTGTDGESRASAYISDELTSYGYEVELQEFPFDASDFLPARVNVDGEGIPAIAANGSSSGVVSKPLIDAGIGRADEFPSSGSAGAIALIERGELTFAEKVDNAIAAGASAVIIFNNEDGSLLVDLDGDVAIPVVGMRRGDGEALRTQLAAGAVEATVAVTPPRGSGHNVVAKSPGVTTCGTVTGGHYDSVAVTGGADDNASGTAAVLEVARVAAARNLAGDNCFVLFSGEEFGLFGSEAYVASLSDEELNAIRAMLNIDVVGVSVPLGLIGNADLVDIARIQAQQFAVDSEQSTLPENAGSDHLSFQDEGVPVIMFTRPDPLIHTSQDALDRIVEERLFEAAQVAYGTLEALVGA